MRQDRELSEIEKDMRKTKLPEDFVARVFALAAENEGVADLIHLWDEEPEIELIASLQDLLDDWNKDPVASSTDNILALLLGDPGPFLENDNSYFGKKQTDPSMKEAGMETDCGGAVITKAKMTYGEADELAKRVNLTDYPAFIKALTSSVYWESKYEKPQPEGTHFIGEVWWSIYSFLVTKGHIKGDPRSYKNSMEYLFNEVLKRLVKAKVWSVDADWRWFEIGTAQATPSELLTNLEKP